MFKNVTFSIPILTKITTDLYLFFIPLSVYWSVYLHLLFVLLTDLCPKNASYYGNRAATLMMLSRFREALEDSQQAVRLDDTFMKVSPLDILSI